MVDRTPQQLADQINALQARAVNVVEGTIASYARPGSVVSFTYRNSIDGSTRTETGIAWNECIPTRVSALKQDNGQWVVVGQHEAVPVRSTVLMDRRTNPQKESGGKIKVLFSTIEGDERVFWVGGDRATPKRIHTIPSVMYLEEAMISNAGDGFLVGLKCRSTPASSESLEPYTMLTISAQTQWVVKYLRAGHYSPSDFYSPKYTGHGFWTQTLGYQDGLDTSFSSFSQFLGESRETPGGSSWTDPNSVTPSVDRRSFNAISPDRNRYTYAVSSETNSLDDYFERDVREAKLLGKNARSAIYYHLFERYGPIYLEVGRANAVFVDCVANTDVEIDSSLGFNSEWSVYDDAPICNLIGSTLYRINPGVRLGGFGDTVIQIPESTWKPTQSANLKIDIYSLGANTTKRSIKAKVYPLKANAQIHSLSYHP